MPGDFTAFATDPLLRMLTDALRDGPGSPAWHAAVQRLNEVDTSQSPNAPAAMAIDEYRRLCQAREHLESGKEFRSIRPGPVFTQRLWIAIDSQTRKHTWTARRTIAIISVICILLGCAAVIWEMIPAGTPIERELALLTSTLFSNPIASLDSSDELPTGWRAVGTLPLRGAHDLTLPANPHVPSPTGGGYVTVNSIAASKPIAIEARFQINRATNNLVPEVAVADDEQFSANTSTNPHELVFALEGKQAKLIAPDGRLAAQAEMPGDGHGELMVRYRVDGQAVIVEMNGRTIFAGPNGLRGNGQRFVAVRILKRGPADSQNVALRSIQVLGAK